MLTLIGHLLYIGRTLAKGLFTFKELNFACLVFRGHERYTLLTDIMVKNMEILSLYLLCFRIVENIVWMLFEVLKWSKNRTRKSICIVWTSNFRISTVVHWSIQNQKEEMVCWG
jgi:hypothetical protein